MKWTKITRASGLIEHVCVHGVGHPDPESAIKVSLKYSPNRTEKEIRENGTAWTVHCCDGCCCRDDFPGKVGSPKD